MDGVAAAEVFTDASVSGIVKVSTALGTAGIVKAGTGIRMGK